MSNVMDIHTAWAAVWSEKGSFYAEKMVEHLTKVNMACLEGRRVEDHVIGVLPTLETAMRYNLEIKRMRRGRLAAVDGTISHGPIRLRSEATAGQARTDTDRITGSEQKGEGHG